MKRVRHAKCKVCEFDAGRDFWALGNHYEKNPTHRPRYSKSPEERRQIAARKTKAVIKAEVIPPAINHKYQVNFCPNCSCPVGEVKIKAGININFCPHCSAPLEGLPEAMTALEIIKNRSRR